MAQLAPVVKRKYTDEERAVIAGYLLGKRAGVLKALSSSFRYAELTKEFGAENQLRYYQLAEAFTRWELYWIGYTVQKDQMYAGT